MEGSHGEIAPGLSACVYWLDAPVHSGDDCVLCALVRQADSRGWRSDDSVVEHAGPQPDSCASDAFVWPVEEAALGRGRAVMLCAAVITVVWAMVAVAQN